MHTYLCLIDPHRNKFRSYSITEQANLFGGRDLIVTWGRIGKPQRRRDERFTSGEDLERRKGELLARRRRHGYTRLDGATDKTNEEAER